MESIYTIFPYSLLIPSKISESEWKEKIRWQLETSISGDNTNNGESHEKKGRHVKHEMETVGFRGLTPNSGEPTGEEHEH